MSESGEPSRGRIVLTGVFGLLFAGVALFFASLVVWTLIDRMRFADAVETPAMVVQLRLAYTKVNKGKGQRARTEATYTYEFEGRRYESEKIGVGIESPKIYNKLSKAKRAGEPVTCFVDPDKPSRSVLTRKVTVWAQVACGVFAIAFGWIGIVILRQSLFGNSKEGA